MEYETIKDPSIRPFLQNTLNPSELEVLAEGGFTIGWASRYNTVQVAISKEGDYSQIREYQ